MTWSIKNRRTFRESFPPGNVQSRSRSRRLNVLLIAGYGDCYST